MNLAKTALYLEYIAFRLRWHFAPETLGTLPGEPMSKAKTDNSYQQQAVDAAHGNAGADRMAQGLPAVPAEPEKKERRGLDPELQVLATCNRALAMLPPMAQARVLRWLADRHANPQVSLPIDNGVKVLPGDPSYRTGPNTEGKP